MAGLLDETIRMAGVSATIIRSSGNISTYMRQDATGMLAGKRYIKPENEYVKGFLIPSDSGVVVGDYIQSSGINYLVMAIDPIDLCDGLDGYRGTLYQCNEVVSVYGLDAITAKPNDLLSSNTPILISPTERGVSESDSGQINGKWGQKEIVYSVFMQAGQGGETAMSLIDSASRRLRVLKNYDPFVASGLIKISVVLENPSA